MSTKTRKSLVTGLVMLTLGLAATAADAQTKRKNLSQTNSPRLAQADMSAPLLPATQSGFSDPEETLPFEVRRGELAIDAWFDVEARFINKDDLVVSDRGFTLNDAAIYIAKDYGLGRALVDLPFSSGNNLFDLGQAQAYAQLNFGQQFAVRGGKYDSFFSVEANDSKFRFFADEGALDQYLLPDSYLGVQGIFKVDNLTFRAQVTNPAGTWTVQRGGFAENYEYGLNGRYETGDVYGGVGFAIHETRDASVTTNKTSMVLDITGGLLADRLKLEGEFILRKTQTVDKTANGFGLFAVYQIDSFLGIGGRFEYLKDAVIPTVGQTDNVMRVSVGPGYVLTPDLMVRGDFTLDSTKPTVGNDLTAFGISASLVADL